jgi:hypothetical protein
MTETHGHRLWVFQRINRSGVRKQRQLNFVDSPSLRNCRWVTAKKSMKSRNHPDNALQNSYIR